MIRFHIFFCLCMLLGMGCLQSRQHLVIESDGSGTFTVDDFFPKGTISFMKSIGGEPLDEVIISLESEEIPISFADRLFGTKDDIAKKAARVGLKIDFAYFTIKREKNGIWVHYKIRFDDFKKLITSDILAVDLSFSKGKDGSVRCTLNDEEHVLAGSLKSWEQWEGEGKYPLKEAVAIYSVPKGKTLKRMSRTLSSFPKTGSQGFGSLPHAMEDFQMHLFITLPARLKETGGRFKSRTPNTAYISFATVSLKDKPFDQKPPHRNETSSYACWDTHDFSFFSGGGTAPSH